MIDRIVVSFRGEESWMTIYFKDGTKLVKDVDYEFLSRLTNKQEHVTIPMQVSGLYRLSRTA